MDEQERLYKIEEMKMQSWRTSEHYDWVMKVINDELNTPYVKEMLATSYASGTAVDNVELGIAMKVEYQSEARINNIKEALI